MAFNGQLIPRPANPRRTENHLDNNPYGVMFGSGEWTCTIAKWKGKMIGPCDARSWMDLLAPLQHPDELLDPPGTGLRLLRGLNPEEDRVPVGAVQRFEEGLRLPVLRQRDQKIFR